MFQLQAGRYISHRSSQYIQSLLLTLPLGHLTAECKANRVLDTSFVADMTAEDAWETLKKADEERDLDDFREVGSDKRYQRT